MKITGGSRPAAVKKTVIEALKFRSDSELARRIRKAAIERGGKGTEYSSHIA